MSSWVIGESDDVSVHYLLQNQLGFSVSDVNTLLKNFASTFAFSELVVATKGVPSTLMCSI